MALSQPIIVYIMVCEVVRRLSWFQTQDPNDFSVVDQKEDLIEKLSPYFVRDVLNVCLNAKNKFYSP